MILPLSVPGILICLALYGLARRFSPYTPE